MKPLPAAQKNAGDLPVGEDIPSLPADTAKATGRPGKPNRRTPPAPVNRAYPWLLFASTATAAAFCLLYITKPVFTSTAASPEIPAAIPPAGTGGTSATNSLLPTADRLPGERIPAGSTVTPADPGHALPTPPTISAFEETNLRIQHILTAEAPGGHLSRLDLEVPVLYPSRSLRWTAAEIAEARSLLLRLTNHQEKSQQLRAEGAELLDAWNRLIDRSIPASSLRADSPSLPANQEDTADAPRRAAPISTPSVQIQPASK